MRKSRHSDPSDLAAKIQAARAKKATNAITAELGPIPPQPGPARLRWLTSARLMEGRVLCALLYASDPQLAEMELPPDLAGWDPSA